MTVNLAYSVVVLLLKCQCTPILFINITCLEGIKHKEETSSGK